MEPKDLELNVNLSLDGLDMMFKDYEGVMLRRMWVKDIEPTSSGKLWAHVKEVLPSKPDGRDAKSRASVIFAANRFVDAGIWDFGTATGKGGHHRRYFALMTEEQMYAALLKMAIKRLGGQPLSPREIHDLAALTANRSEAEHSPYESYLYEKALGLLDPQWEETYDSLEL